MSVIRRGKNTFLIRVYVGRDPLTGKRIEINETVHGSFSYAVKRETKLKAQKYSNGLIKLSRMTVDALFDLYLDSVRHTVGPGTYYKCEIFYKRYVKPHIGAMSISKITRSDIQRFFNFLLDKKETENEK